MKGSTKTILVFYLFTQVACSKVAVRDKYDNFPNKKLTNIIKTVRTLSTFHCTTWCSMTDGCLAVNVIGNHDITCELTTGLSNENEMQDDSLAELFVSNYNKCNNEPGYCLNGATCEQTWTFAICHCTDRFQGDQCQQCSERFQGDGCQECTSRFQGDECQQCSERFQGDGCQECAPRFQGDECQQCSERFQGDGCQECSDRFQGKQCQRCAQNYYGSDCDVSFTSHPGKRCSERSLLHELTYTSSGNYDDCKEWCVARDDCGGFTLSGGRCYFKTCTANLVNNSGQTTFLKTVN